MRYSLGLMTVSDDTIVSIPAAVRTSAWLKIGGRLYLTKERTVVFWPADYEEPTFSCPFEDVVDVSIDPAGLHDLLTGGVRNRLRIRLNDGQTVLFTVGKPQVTVPHLRSLIMGLRAP